MGSSSTLPSTSALEGGGWSAPRAGRFTPGKDPVPIVIGGWVGPSVGLDSCRNSRPPPGFDSRTIRPVRVAIPTELSRPTMLHDAENNSAARHNQSAFAKLREATISFSMYVCLSVLLAPGGRISSKFDIWVFIETLSRNFRFSPCILTANHFYYPTNALNYIKLRLKSTLCKF